LRHRGGDRTYESRGPSRPLLSQRSRRRCRQRHPQRRRLQPSPRSRLAEDHFARHPTRATPDLHNSASPPTGFLTGDYVVKFFGDQPSANERYGVWFPLHIALRELYGLVSPRIVTEFVRVQSRCRGEAFSPAARRPTYFGETPLPISANVPREVPVDNAR